VGHVCVVFSPWRIGNKGGGNEGSRALRGMVESTCLNLVEKMDR